MLALTYMTTKEKNLKDINMESFLAKDDGTLY